MKNTNLLSKIRSSFNAANSGKESTSILIRRWGIPAYIVSYFIINKLVLAVDYRSFDIIISLITSIYFAWHIYALVKCSPKKPKLSKEEKATLKLQKQRDFGKKFLRKLLLQEPLTKWNPISVSIAVDVLCITNFFGYVLH